MHKNGQISFGFFVPVTKSTATAADMNQQAAVKKWAQLRNKKIHMYTLFVDLQNLHRKAHTLSIGQHQHLA